MDDTFGSPLARPRARTCGAAAVQSVRTSRSGGSAQAVLHVGEALDGRGSAQHDIAAAAAISAIGRGELPCGSSAYQSATNDDI